MTLVAELPARASAFRVGRNWTPAIVKDMPRDPAESDLLRIRVYTNRKISGYYSGRKLCQQESHFLDGLVLHEMFTADHLTYQRREIMSEAITTPTANVTDFERMEKSAVRLLELMFKVGDNPTPQQLATIASSYKGLLTWQEAARDQLVRAEGQIDFVGQKVRSFLS